MIGFQHALLLFLCRISTALSQWISHRMWLLAWEFLLIKCVLHFAFLHLLSGCYYYDYVVIGAGFLFLCRISTVLSQMISPGLLAWEFLWIKRDFISRSCIFFRGRVDNLSFLEYFSPFFLSIEFYFTFSISYKILPHFVYHL